MATHQSDSPVTSEVSSSEPARIGPRDRLQENTHSTGTAG